MTLPVNPMTLHRWIRDGYLRLPLPGTGCRRPVPAEEMRAMLALESCRRLGGVDPSSESRSPATRALMSTVAEVARTHPPGTAVEITTPCPYVRHVVIVPEP